jgi:hypothetical protein
VKISRCEERLQNEIDVEEWPLLFDVPLADDGVDVTWESIHGGGRNDWVVEVRLSGPGEEGQRHRYQLELEPSDVGELLRRMPEEAVQAVIGGLLGGGRPEVIGTVVGQIVAHLARRGMGLGGSQNA